MTEELNSPPNSGLHALDPSVARQNVHDIVRHAIEHRDDHAAVVVWDGGCALARTLTDGYRNCLPEAMFIEFGETPPEEILEVFRRLSEGDLVVLVQSTNFRLNAFRIRMELFRRSIKVIEHPHLSRMLGSEPATYVHALAYDPDYYRGVGHRLKSRLDGVKVAVLDSGGESLIFGAGLEPAKLNVGDYGAMKNIGGQFPIGEVFTESRDLEAVHGRVRIRFFGDTNFRVNRPPVPITLVVEAGRVVDTQNSTDDFDRILDRIREVEEQVWLRELGCGMNRAFSETSTVSDVGTFERMCGVHLSLGAKHASYKKPQIRNKSARFHVDVFAVTESLRLDGENVFADGEWQVRD